MSRTPSNHRLSRSNSYPPAPGLQIVAVNPKLGRSNRKGVLSSQGIGGGWDQLSPSLSKSAQEKMEDKYALADWPSSMLVKEVMVAKEDK
ncbi:hypothetical protein BGX20_001411, partial [Mortierella sp. AD010]